MIRRLARPHWGVAKAVFSTKPCWQFGVPAGQCSPQQAVLQVTFPPAAQLPLTWGDWENPEQLTPATPLTSSPQPEYGLAHSTRSHTSGRKDRLVPRELGKVDPGSLDAVHSQRISDTPRALARETLVHHQCQGGTAICAAGGGGQTEGEGSSPPSAENRSSHSQSSFCGAQERGRLEVDNRPKIPQFMYSTTTLQDGGSVHAAQYRKSGMAYGKIRSKRRIFNHPYGQRVLESSCIPGWPITQTDAVPLPSVRALDRTIRLLENHKANNSVSTPVIGIHLIIYLDDLLLAAPTKEQLLVNLSTALWLFTSLGFLINIPKSITTPICHLEFLGFKVDMETMMISLPTHKIHAIQKEVSRLLSLKKVPVRDLACLIGTLVATKPAVWTGSLHYRALQDLKIRSLWQHPSDQTAMNLSEEARADLQWWFSDLSSTCSATMVKPEASIVIESDASKSGWGAVCQGVATGGRWTSEEAGLHINLLELQAVFLALQSFLKDKTKVAVLVRSDNRTAIAYLNKMGSPTRSQLCLLALEIWEWCLLHLISPHAEYLAGKDNVLADWESRHHDSSDWQLLPSVFEAINHLLGPFTIDLFASRTNAQLPVYCS